MKEVKNVSEIEKLDKVEYDGIDIKNALNQIGGNKKLYISILNKFKNKYCSAFDDIIELLSGSDKKSAYVLVHSIKGLSGNLGAYNLQKTAQYLEDVIKDSNVEYYEKALNDFEYELRNVLCFICSLDKENKRDIEKQHIDNYINDLNNEEIKVIQGFFDELNYYIDLHMPIKVNKLLTENLKFVKDKRLKDYLMSLKDMILEYKFEEATKLLGNIEKQLRRG